MNKWDWVIVCTFIVLMFLVFSGCAEAGPRQAPLDNAVRIRREDKGGASASGFMVQDRIVVTNKHCVEFAKVIWIKFADGKWEKIKANAKNIYAMDGHDLAYIRVKHKAPMRLTVSVEDNYIGREIYMVSMPSTYEFRWVTTGIVGSKVVSMGGFRSNWSAVRVMDIDGRGGCSGSMILDRATDELVGVFCGNNNPCMTIMQDILQLRELLAEVK